MTMLNTLGRRFFSVPAFGVPAARLSRRLGLKGIARKTTKWSGYAPPMVRVAIPGGGLQDGKLALHNTGARNHLAVKLWLDGWSGYEPPLPELFFHAANTASCVVDVGAHTGYYTLLALASSSKCKVIACEPFPEALEGLRENIELNKVTDRVVVEPRAVGDSTGTSRLYVPQNNFTVIETSCSLNPHFRDRHSDVIDVEVTTLDELAGSRDLHVEVLKIDVESQEHRVLAGAGAVLAKCRPMIFLEVLSSADCESLERCRHAYGYTACRITQDRIVIEKAVEHWKDHPNQALCPDEKLEWLSDIAARCGLAVS